MMIRMCKKISLVVMIVVFLLPLSVLAEKEYAFTDVGKGFWAETEIEWAYEQGILIGYEDGTFRPNRSLTEAQFAIILARYFNNVDTSVLSDGRELGQHWSQPIYDVLGQYGLPLRGYSDNGVKNKPVTRGTIARVITASQEVIHYELTPSIHWMYENQITARAHSNDRVADYGSRERLTRAQAVTFIYRMHNAGFPIIEEFFNTDMKQVNTLTEDGVDMFLAVNGETFNRNESIHVVADFRNVSGETIQLFGADGCDSGLNIEIYPANRTEGDYTSLPSKKKEYRGYQCTQAIEEYEWESGLYITNENIFYPMVTSLHGQPVHFQSGEYVVEATVTTEVGKSRKIALTINVK